MKRFLWGKTIPDPITTIWGVTNPAARNDGLIPRHPFIFSDNDWDVQSPPKCIGHLGSILRRWARIPTVCTNSHNCLTKSHGWQLHLRPRFCQMKLVMRWSWWWDFPTCGGKFIPTKFLQKIENLGKFEVSPRFFDIDILWGISRKTGP